MAPSAASDVEFPVSIVMEGREKQRDQWRFVEWSAIGVLTAEELLEAGPRRLVIHEEGDCQRILWTNFSIRLVKDGAESYWSNLMAEHPSLFVVCRRDDSGEPEPFLVTVNYDDIIGYEEVDDDVYSLPLPPDLCKWLERYVVNNYVPQVKKKRKRIDWSESTDVQASSGQRRH